MRNKHYQNEKNRPATNHSGFNKNNQLNNKHTKLAFHYFRLSRLSSANFQCKICGSDYWRFAIDGICIDCQQRCEFIVRERRTKQGGQKYV